MKKRSQSPKNAPIGTHEEEVGGRQSASFLGSWGGGYLDNYSSSKLRPEKIALDPRLAELRLMGMHHTWQKVAGAIGMDAFLTMWRILDSEEQFRHHRGPLEIHLRSYKSYLRFQRNEYIKSLDKAGLTPDEISERLKSSMCESLDISHIKRIINKG